MRYVAEVKNLSYDSLAYTYSLAYTCGKTGTIKKQFDHNRNAFRAGFGPQSQGNRKLARILFLIATPIPGFR